jgi:hypothetical protein
MRRFWAYWKENLQAGKEKHEWSVFVIAFIVLVLSGAGRIIGFNIGHSETATHDTLGIAEILSGVYCGAWVLLWLPFKRHEAQERERDEKVKMLRAQLETLNDLPQLEIELVDPASVNRGNVDLRILRWLLQARVSNRHPTKTAKNVKLLLTKIEWNAAYPKKIPIPFKQILFPILLPETGGATGSAYDIPPKQFSKSFDLFFVGGDYPAYRTVGIAPIVPFTASNPKLGLTQEIVLMRTSESPDYVPPQQYFHTTVHLCWTYPPA